MFVAVLHPVAKYSTHGLVCYVIWPMSVHELG